MAFYGNGANITSLPSPASLSTASGSAPSYSVRAYVNFFGDGSTSIRRQGNVSSVAYNGTGDYFVNFSTAMPSSDHCVLATSDTNGNGGACINVIQAQAGLTSPTTSQVRVMTIHDGGTRINIDWGMVAIIA